LLGVILSLGVGAIFYFFLNMIYGLLQGAIPYILLSIILLLILNERNFNGIFWAFLIVLFSGGYGIFVLNSTQISNPLLLLFTGVFGIATILQSLQNQSFQKLPKQDYKIKFNFDKDFLKSSVIGTFSASICCVTPGIGNIQAATIASFFLKKIKTENFIVILSLINTLNFILSLITFYTIKKARNGSIHTISQITSNITITEILGYYLIVLVCSVFIFFITIHLGKQILKLVSKINFRKINTSILLFLLILITFIDGFYGLLVLLGASSLGLLTISLGVKRVHLMSVLIVPVVINLLF